MPEATKTVDVKILCPVFLCNTCTIAIIIEFCLQGHMKIKQIKMLREHKGSQEQSSRKCHYFVDIFDVKSI